jgi:hypothetical protein
MWPKFSSPSPAEPAPDAVLEARAPIIEQAVPREAVT